MKKKLLLFLLPLFGTTGFCKTLNISNTGNIFNPATITINLGDSVNFTLGSIYNAVEVSEATWGANETAQLTEFCTPLGGGLILPAQLTVGTHYYVCTDYAFLGMKGIIIVKDPSVIKEIK